MKTVLLEIFLCMIGLAFADVASQFRAARIEPDVIDQAPTELLEVEYPVKKVYLGNDFRREETAYKPKVRLNDDGNSLYTLVMMDPDIGTPGELLHWLIGNIPNGSVLDGDVLGEYFGPSVSPGSGVHRLTFLLYIQNEGFINFNQSFSALKQRMSFYTRKFAEKYNLENPVAGNYFRSEVIRPVSV